MQGQCGTAVLQLMTALLTDSSSLHPQTSLHLATYLNLIDVMKSLLEKGASLELQDQDGNTPLHVACQHGKMECATEMTRDISPCELAPVLETQNWRGEEDVVSASSV